MLIPMLSKSVGKNTTVLREINEAKTLFPPAFCLLPPASSQLQIFTPFYLPDLISQTSCLLHAKNSILILERAGCPLQKYKFSTQLKSFPVKDIFYAASQKNGIT
jgi:hypothetical protein